MDIDSLNHIVQAGGIAIIDTWNTTLTPIMSKGRDFTAISHVWGHGLGNPESNSMNACLLQKLFALAEKCGTRAIWIDTLCVPTRNRYPDQWRMALDSMRLVYSIAHKVLVIDEHLLGCSDNLSLRQFELLQCDWMHRLWTLQEMLLPSVENIFIAFGDDVIAAPILLAEASCNRLTQVGFEDILHHDLCEKFQIKEDSTIQKSHLTQSGECIIATAIKKSQLMAFNTDDATIREILQESAETCAASARAVLADLSMTKPRHVRIDHENSRLWHIRKALVWRAVTNPADEPICLATLLNIDPSDLPQQITMESIYTALGMVPLWLLMSTGPRLDSTGFRWALRSFMSSYAALGEDDPRCGAVTEHGLLLTSDCFVASVASLLPLGRSLTLMIQGPGLPDDLMFTGLESVASTADGATDFVLLIHPPERLKEGGRAMACILLIQEDTSDLLITHFLCAGMMHRGTLSSVTLDSRLPRSTYTSCQVFLRPETTILVT